MDVLDKIGQNRESLVEQFGVERIGVFGSVSRGETTEESDVDVLVEFKAEESTFDNYMGLKFYLEELLESDVDLVTAGSIKPRIKEKILEQVKYV
ncbi:MAG: nucleotidyltransferase family protein [bacterium]